MTLSTSERVMIFAPHPDDEALGNGALIQLACKAGAQVRVVFVTDGDNNPWPQRALEHRWSIGAEARSRWGRRRRGEAVRALQTLGLRAEDAVFLGLPDQGLTSLWQRRDPRTMELHASELKRFQPTLVSVPSHVDRHPDHRGSFAIVQASLQLAEMNVPQWAYLIHRRWFHPAPTGVALHLTPQQKAAKLAAIQCHETQLFLSHRRFCAYAREREIFMPVGA